MESDETVEKIRWGNSPLAWLTCGVVATLLIVAAGAIIFSQMLTQTVPEPAEISNVPTIIRVTAPPTAVPSATPIIPTPTSIPTFTPSPTPDRLIAPDELTSGFFAQVANTDGVGVNLRNGTGRSNELIQVLAEDSVGLVIDGPVDTDGFVWWRLELKDGVRGWVVEQFLIPAGEPLDWRN